MKKILLTTVAALAVASPAFAASDFKAGDIMIRGRALGVMPDESSSMNIATSIKLSNSYVPELDATYFFTPNIAAEVIAAVTPHHVSTKSGVNAGDVWLLPPTVTLQYHFTQLASVKPYVGAGINYTHFFGASGGALNHPEYTDSVGPALQVGADIPLQGNWYANLDVKKLWIDTTAKFTGVRADVDIDPWVVGVGVGYKF